MVIYNVQSHPITYTSSIVTFEVFLYDGPLCGGGGGDGGGGGGGG